MNKEEYLKLAGEITEKLDNTAEYENWLTIQDYIDDLQSQLEKEKSIRKEAIEYIKNRCEFFADDEDGTVYYDNVLSDNDIYGILSILEKE